MIEQIRQIIGAEYANTLGLVVYKNSEIVLEEYFKGANREESVHTFSIVKSIVAILPQIGGKQAIGEQFHYMIPTAPTAWAVRWWR